MFSKVTTSVQYGGYGPETGHFARQCAERHITLDDVLKPRKYDRRLRPGFKRNDFSIPSKFKEDYALVV